MTSTDLARKTEEVANRDVGVMEDPPCSNLGPRIESYQDFTGLPHGSAYCASACSLWVYTAATESNVDHMFKKSGSALHLWANNPGLQFTTLTADAIPCIGINQDDDHIHGHGHAFLIVGMDTQGQLQTIDPNSSVNGGREGDGVHLLNKRSTQDSNRVGYIRIA